MKTLFAALLSVLISGFSFAQSTTNPGEYMDYFSVEYLKIQEQMWDYTKAVSHGRSARKVDKTRTELITSAQAALKKAKSAKEYQGNSSYRDSVVRFLTIVDIVLREDYAKIVDMEAVAEQSYDAMEAYMLARELANDKVKAAGDMIDREHRAFAAANGVTIIESEGKLNDKIDVANKVYDHYNAVYLIFFKSFKQEAYLLDAMGRNDIAAIEQNRNALTASVEEGLQKLDTVTKYEGDPAMITATRQLLNFYKTEAESNVQTALDYLEANETFQKTKQAFDQIKEKNRTQQDVDQYNNAVNALNKAVEKFNKTNDESNAKRSELIDNWNKTAEKFTDRHVPKGK